MSWLFVSIYRQTVAYFELGGMKVEIPTEAPGMSFDPDNIPLELRERKQWVAWKTEKVAGRSTKVPYQTNGRKASVSAPKTWNTFEAVRRYAIENGLGVGFVLTESDPYCGIDFDHVVRNGRIEPWAKEIVELFGSYTEVSPSGEGLRSIVKGKMPDKMPNSTVLGYSRLELWDRRRFVTITGRLLVHEPIRGVDLSLLLPFIDKENSQDKGEKVGRIPSEEEIGELDKLLETGWDLDKPENVGSHWDLTLSAASILGKCGKSLVWFEEHIAEFTTQHPCSDGQIHPPEDLRKAVRYVQDHDYQKESRNTPLGLRRKIWALFGRTEKSNSAGHQINSERVARMAKGLEFFELYFAVKMSTLTADKLSSHIDFLTLKAEDANIERLSIYSFRNFYRPDGRLRIAQELERVRKLMLQRSRIVHARYDGWVKAQLKELRSKLKHCTEREEKLELQRGVDALERFLILPGPLMISKAFREGISDSIAARTLITTQELNRPPEGGLFRIAIENGALEGYLTGGKLQIRLVPFDPRHRITRSIDVDLCAKGLIKHAKLWYDVTMKALGSEAGRALCQMFGYLLINTYPLPTERTIYYLVGDPNTGKGTHLAGIERLLTYDGTSLYARASPHKFCDPREHFSKQNLRDKALITHGDIPHRKIRDYSEVNDLFGGQSFEFEKKFKDPMNEIPTFKAIWGSTLPLHKIEIPGGLWRRCIIGVMNKSQSLDKAMKPHLLKAVDGLFLNMLIGLAELSTDHWEFAGEKSDEELEEMWDFLSDSVAQWANERIVPDVSNQLLVDDSYENYVEWCSQKQASPVGRKTFAKQLPRLDPPYPVERKTVDGGRPQFIRAMYVESSEASSMHSRLPKYAGLGKTTPSWSEWAERAGLVFEKPAISLPDSCGQTLCRLFPLGGLHSSSIHKSSKGCPRRSGRNRHSAESVSSLQEPRSKRTYQTTRTYSRSSAMSAATMNTAQVLNKSDRRNFDASKVVEKYILSILSGARGEYMEQSPSMLSMTIRAYGMDLSADQVKESCDLLVTEGKLRARSGKYSLARVK